MMKLPGNSVSAETLATAGVTPGFLLDMIVVLQWSVPVPVQTPDACDTRH